MAYLATSHTALRLCLSGRERREVIVKHNLLVVLDENLIGLFHIHLGTKGNGGQGLSLAAGEDCGTVGARQVIDFAPDRAHLVAYTTVETYSLVENHIPHSFLLHVVIVPVDERLLLFEFLLRNGGAELGLDGLEAVLTLMLRLCGLCKGIALVIAEFIDCLPEVLVLRVVRVIPLHLVAELPDELLLDTAVLLDFLVGELDGLEHIVLADLFHLTLDHHYVLLGSGDHKFDVALFHLGESRVDYELAVDTAYANLGDRAFERQVRGGQGAGCGKSGKRVRLYVLLSGDQGDIHEGLEVVVRWPERPDRTVDETGDKNLIIRGFSFSLHKSARETACGIILFLVVNGQRHEIRTLLDFLCCADRCQKHRASHLYHCGAIRLLGQFTGLDFNHPSVRQFDLFVYDIHLFLFSPPPPLGVD